MNYEVDRKTLEQRADELDSQIDKLYTERNKIHDQIRKLDSEQVEITNNILDVNTNACIVAIAKNEDYHYTLFDIFYIKEVDKKRRQIICKEYTYRFDDYEYTFSAKETHLSIHIFHDMKDQYFLFRINCDTYHELLNNCLGLTLKHDDIKVYRDICRANRLGSIET